MRKPIFPDCTLKKCYGTNIRSCGNCFDVMMGLSRLVCIHLLEVFHFIYIIGHYDVRSLRTSKSFA